MTLEPRMKTIAGWRSIGNYVGSLAIDRRLGGT